MSRSEKWFDSKLTRVGNTGNFQRSAFSSGCEGGGGGRARAVAMHSRLPFGKVRSEKRCLIRGWNKLCAQQPEPRCRVPPQPVSGFQSKAISQPHTTNQQRSRFRTARVSFLFQQFLPLLLFLVPLSSPCLTFSSSGDNPDTC